MNLLDHHRRQFSPAISAYKKENIMRLARSVFFMCTALLIFLAGCATKAVDPKDDSLSMVYGYMGGDSSLFGPMKWATLKENGQTPTYHDLTVTRGFSERGGLFWHMGLKPGSYQLDDFGLPDIRYKYGQVTNNITTIRVTDPGLHYMGSYWHENKSKIIVVGFDIQRANKPTEKEIVQRLIKLFESDGMDKVYVRQYGLLKNRLAQLSR